ncbi:unnamed protein product [Brassica oleracea]
MLSVPVLVFHHLLLLLMLQMCIIALPSCLYLFVLTIRAYIKEPTTPVKKKATKEKERQESLIPVGDGPRISQAVSLSLSRSIHLFFCNFPGTFSFPLFFFANFT